MLGDVRFIHQHAVAIYCAQHAGENTHPISVAFALIGLYLTYERDYTGWQVQHMHILLAQRCKVWTRFVPIRRADAITIADVLRAQPGAMRGAALFDWGQSVWDSWREEHGRVRAFFDRVLGNDESDTRKHAR